MSDKPDDIESGQWTNRKTTAVDLSLMLSVGVLLTALHLILPESMKMILSFDYSEFNVWRLYTSAFVQHSTSQLMGNIGGYLVAALYIYWLVSEVDARAWFRRTFFSHLTVLPPLVMFTSYTVFALHFQTLPPVERGFSGVAAGFGGFLLVVLAVYLRKVYNLNLGNIAGISVFLVLLVEVHYIYAGGVSPLIIGLALIGILFQLGWYLREHEIHLDSRVTSLQTFKPLILFSLVIIVLSTLMIAMFPTDPVEDETFVNIVAHAAGFFWGGLIATTTLVVPRFID